MAPTEQPEGAFSELSRGSPLAENKSIRMSKALSGLQPPEAGHIRSLNLHPVLYLILALDRVPPPVTGFGLQMPADKAVVLSLCCFLEQDLPRPAAQSSGSASPTKPGGLEGLVVRTPRSAQ